jgi:hypothetical protein
MEINYIMIEVPPSDSNIALPPETTEYFSALPSGVFMACTTEWTPMPTACAKKAKSLEQQRTENMADNARRLEQLGLSSKGIKKTNPPRKSRKPCLWSGKTASVCPPMSRRNDKIPAKKIRFEPHPLLHQRVSVLWDELDGPTSFNGTVVKFDSTRPGAPFLVSYDDGEEQWELDVLPGV